MAKDSDEEEEEEAASPVLGFLYLISYLLGSTLSYVKIEGFRVYGMCTFPRASSNQACVKGMCTAALLKRKGLGSGVSCHSLRVVLLQLCPVDCATQAMDTYPRTITDCIAIAPRFSTFVSPFWTCMYRIYMCR